MRYSGNQEGKNWLHNLVAAWCAFWCSIANVSFTRLHVMLSREYLKA